MMRPEPRSTLERLMNRDRVLKLSHTTTAALVSVVLLAAGCGDGGGRTDAGSAVDAAPDTGCTTAELSCMGICINPKIDPRNCGACGNMCPTGAACNDQVCSCPPRFIVCGRGCVNAQADLNNCGTCNTVCPAGMSCIAGTCGVPQRDAAAD